MAKTCVHLIGGHGVLTARYRAVAGEYSAELQQYEHDAPSTLGERAILVVCMSMCSHDQRAIAQRLAARFGLELQEMPRYSVGALREVLAALPPCATSQRTEVWQAAHELARRSEEAFRATLRFVRENPAGLWGECRGCGSTLMRPAPRKAQRVTVAGVRL